MHGPPKSGSCRFCGTPLSQTVVDLGMSPLCENFLTPEQLNDVERFYPLHLWVCDQCFLVQLEEYVSGSEIFSDYAYFSSFSDSWLDALSPIRRANGRTAGADGEERGH